MNLAPPRPICLFQQQQSLSEHEVSTLEVILSLSFWLVLSEHVYIHMLKISSCPFFGVFLRFCFLLEVLLFFVDDISSFSQDVSKGLTTHLNSLLMGWFPWVFVLLHIFKHFGFNGIDLWKDVD